MGLLSRLFGKKTKRAWKCPKVYLEFEDNAQMRMLIKDGPIKLEFPNKREEMIFPCEVWTVAYDPSDELCVHHYEKTQPRAILVAKGREGGPPW